METKSKIIIGSFIGAFIIFAGSLFAIGGFINAQGEEIPEIYDYDANTKTIRVKDITIVAPADINCEWTDPNADWKLCTVEIAVTNHNLIHDFIEKDSPMSDFKHSVTDMEVYTSPLLNTYQESVLNSTCFDNLNLTEEEMEDFDDSICRYNVTRYDFNDWKIKDKLDKFPKNDTLGVKLIFKSPILQDSNNYLKNQFNFSIFGEDYDVILDPDISACTVLSTAGATYTLNASITDSATSFCMNITADNIILDCQGHTIDGNNNADYGIYVSRASQQTTNVTIKNCVLTDWDTRGIYFYYSDSNTLTNITANSNQDDGIDIRYSDSNILTNIIANSNSQKGIDFGYSDSNTLTNITANSNTYGIYYDRSHSNTLTNITANLNTNIGLRLFYSGSGILTNVNLFNNTSFDIENWVGASSECNSKFTNVTGTDNKPILFYNSSVIIDGWNNNVSSLILCNADNSIINNLVIDHTDKENNELFIIYSDEINITNSKFIEMKNGIRAIDSDSIRLINITINSNYNGIYMRNSDSNTLTNITANSNTYGIDLLNSHSNTFTNVIVNSSTYLGLRFDGNYNQLIDSTSSFQSGISNIGLFIDDDHNIIKNVTFEGNYYGIQFDTTADNNTITNCTIINSVLRGIYMNSPASVLPNSIYNNLFNNTLNIYLSDDVDDNCFNTTNQTGTRIFSDGTNIGGNYYTNSTGNDYSDTCTDSDTDGFCDLIYDVKNDSTCTIGINCSKNIDYLPYSNKYSTEEPPPDTCTYVSGNWIVNCNDNCTITANTDIGENQLILAGTGQFTILANISAGLLAVGPDCQLNNVPGDGKELRVKG